MQQFARISHQYCTKQLFIHPTLYISQSATYLHVCGRVPLSTYDLPRPERLATTAFGLRDVCVSKFKKQAAHLGGTSTECGVTKACASFFGDCNSPSCIHFQAGPWFTRALAAHQGAEAQTRPYLRVSLYLRTYWITSFGYTGAVYVEKTLEDTFGGFLP